MVKIGMIFINTPSGEVYIFSATFDYAKESLAPDASAALLAVTATYASSQLFSAGRRENDPVVQATLIVNGVILYFVASSSLDLLSEPGQRAHAIKTMSGALKGEVKGAAIELAEQALKSYLENRKNDN
jgi:hypothetical protein